MSKQKVDPNNHYEYLHGYSKEESERLLTQAQFLENEVYSWVDWPRGAQSILEPGCGVGAQSKILCRRFPNLQFTCVDREASQLKWARQNLPEEIKNKQVELVEAFGEKLPFAESSFDGAFICWLLEHISQPENLLKEIHRVLKPGASIYCTEVLNSSFYLHPYAPATLQYWFAFNDHQWNVGGDPFCGAKLANHLSNANFKNIETQFRDFLLDKREPKKRLSHLQKYYDLLMSAAPELLKHQRISPELLDEVKNEWTAVMSDPQAVLNFSFVQARAQAL